MVTGVQVTGGGQLCHLLVILVTVMVLVLRLVIVTPGRHLLSVQAHVTAGLIQHLLEPHDVVHCLGQDVHFRHLLDCGSFGHMSPQSLKARVNCLHSIPFSLISLDSFKILLRFDRIAMYRVYRNHIPGSHARQCYLC